MTSVAPAVPQLVLPGQAAAPEGPVDIAPMYLMHRAFRRDLDAFARAVPAVPPSDAARWARLARRFAFFGSVLHKHHRGEDVALWPLLAERGADPAVLDALQAEHAAIDPLLDAASDDLGTLAAGDADAATRDRLAATVERLRDLLGAHLGHEERDGMALVQQHLAPADWERLDREVFAKDYRLREVPAVLGWVMSGLAPEHARRLPGANAPFLAFGRLMASWFDRREARVFGDSRPARKDRVLTVVTRVVARWHVALYRRSGGRLANRFRGGDVLMLTHTGRRSGQVHTTPVAYVRDGEDLVVAASNGGIDAEPQWWLNLQADPRCTVEVRGRRIDVVAAEVEEPERSRLWGLLNANIATYDAYQASVRRRIAVVRLTPTTSG
ncbi:nitroreductase/quinone reductase family protein [Blastococcus sp. SYSU D01042]